MNGEIHRASSVAQQAPYVSKMTRKLVLYSYCTVAVRRSVHRPRAETAESVMMSLTRMELCKFVLYCPVLSVLLYVRTNCRQLQSRRITKGS